MPSTWCAFQARWHVQSAWQPSLHWTPLTPVLLVCAKDEALHMELKKENLEPGLEQGQKPRLDSVSSSSFTSSSFPEDRSVSDMEGDEGKSPLLPASSLGISTTYWISHTFFSFLIDHPNKHPGNGGNVLPGHTHCTQSPFP